MVKSCILIGSDNHEQSQAIMRKQTKRRRDQASKRGGKLWRSPDGALIFIRYQRGLERMFPTSYRKNISIVVAWVPPIRLKYRPHLRPFRSLPGQVTFSPAEFRGDTLVSINICPSPQWWIAISKSIFLSGRACSAATRKLHLSECMTRLFDRSGVGGPLVAWMGDPLISVSRAFYLAFECTRN